MRVQRAVPAVFTLLGCAGSAFALPQPDVSLTPAAILADGKKAFMYAKTKITTTPGCGWTRGTYMIGLWDYYNASSDPVAKEFLQSWGKHYAYKLCARGDTEQEPLGGPRRRLQGPCEGDKLPCKGVHNANNQLCGATYAEMFMNMVGSSPAMLTDTVKIFGEEIADAPDSNNFWSWVDASFMAMNTWARMGAATGEVKYYEKQWTNFQAAMLLPPDGKKTFGFWNSSTHLFYRDDRFLGTSIYWGRGNGWAMGALVAAIKYGHADSHRADYIKIFKLQAAKLASIQGPDGAWRASLLNATGYPTPEMTGTSSFCYGIAFGINAGILDKATYAPVVAKAWKFMSGTALQKSGLYGYCQPVGGSPEHNINPTSTSDFCVGQFLLGTVQVSKLAQVRLHAIDFLQCQHLAEHAARELPVSPPVMCVQTTDLGSMI